MEGRDPRARYASHDESAAALEWQPNPVFRLVPVDPSALQLHHDLRVLVDAFGALEPDHPARPNLERLAESAVMTIDWSSPGSTSFRQSLYRAHIGGGKARLCGLMAAEYEPTLIAAGHAHIDCAWFVAIEQTREKAGRT